MTSNYPANARPTHWGDTPTSPKRSGMRIQRGPHNVFVPDSELLELADQIVRHLAPNGHGLLNPADQEQREAILALGAMAGQEMTVTYPGQILEDADGAPLAVSQNRTEQATSIGVTITRAEATRYRIPDDAPGVQIINLEGDRK